MSGQIPYRLEPGKGSYFSEKSEKSPPLLEYSFQKVINLINYLVAIHTLE